MTRSTIRRSLAVLVAAVVLGSAGCGVQAQDGAGRVSAGGSGTTAGSTGKTGSSRAPAAGSLEGTAGASALAKAASATGDVKTEKVKMTMAIQGIPTAGDLSIEANGEFDNAAKQGHMTLDMGDVFGSLGEDGGSSLPKGAGTMEMVVDGTTIYLKSPLFSMSSDDGKPWQKVDAGTFSKDGGALAGSAQSDPGAFLDFLKGAGGKVTEVGTEQVRGVETTHVKTDIDLKQLLDQAAGDQKDELRKQLEGLGAGDVDLPSIPADAWIDGDGYVRKFSMAFDFSKLAGSSSGAAAAELDGAKMTMTVELYDFDQPVDITIPPAAQVATLDLSDLGTGGN